MKISQYHTIYFLGIGGIGMSGLASYFYQNGKRVLGYDKTSSNITTRLEKQGIQVFFEKDLRPLETLSSETTLVIYTPAISKEQSDLLFFKQHGFDIFKRSEILGEVSKTGFCLAVGGTHGKTTISCILTHLLKTARNHVTAFLGGISNNYNSNFISGNNKTFVVEADEYDQSFLKLSPDVICISSIDSDHLDTYSTAYELEKSFDMFAQKVEKTCRVVKNNLSIQGVSFGIEDNSDFTAQDIMVIPGYGFEFNLKTPSKTFKKVKFSGFGKHNLLNALAAFVMATKVDGVDAQKLIEGLSTFKGVKRRFSYEINRADLIYIDDYAHHPIEIKALHDAVRMLHPNKLITVVFQPHLYSRTRDFMDDFAKSLSDFDTVILLEIYPARESPIKGITSKKLLDNITVKSKMLCKKSNVIQTLVRCQSEILLTLGAGDIGEEVSNITKALTIL